jgi:hypothetical protein
MSKRRGWSFTYVLAGASLLALGAGAFVGAPPSEEAVKAAAMREFDKNALPLLSKSCLSCHSGADPSGNLDLSKIKSARDALAEVDLMDRVAMNLRNKTMPPVRSKPMPEPDREKLLNSVNDLLRTECSAEDPGRVTIRRLNRFEYTNTVRDLVGVDVSPAQDFPSDDVGYGFDNIGDVLSLSPLHLEQYLAAAERLTDAAFAAPRTTRTQVDFGSMKREGVVSVDEGLVFFSVGTASFDHAFRQAGGYSLKVTAYQSPGGNEAAKMQVIVDGRVVDTFNVSALASKPLVYELPMDVSAPASRAIGLRFTNDFYQAGVADRNLYILGVEVAGPVGAVQTVPRLHRELLPEAVAATGIRDSARSSLRKFASRAYRRPVTDAELDRLMRLFDRGLQGGTRVEAMKLAVQGVLTSPSFIFRAELGGGAPGKAFRLSNYDVASRLSYFLWGSMPDEALTESARSGALSTDKGLLEQVQRMSSDARVRALADSFAMQWLELERLESRLPDPQVFPGWSEELRRDMVQETKLFFTDIMQNNRTVLDFIDGPYTYVNERLARHYGIRGVSGDKFVRVNLEGTARGGLITQGSVLTVTSNPTRTSPVKRGKWIMEAILGTPPPPPPPGVDEIKPDVKNQPITIREKMELHRENPACAVCHQKMDPLGFGLENFDGVGAWREKDNGQPVDASGTLPGKIKFEGPVELKTVLKTRRDEFARTFASKLLTYALGRGLRSADRCFVDGVAEAAKKEGYTFQSFVRAIVLSDAFRKQSS